MTQKQHRVYRPNSGATARFQAEDAGRQVRNELCHLISAQALPQNGTAFRIYVLAEAVYLNR